MRTRTVRSGLPRHIWFVRCNSGILAAVPPLHPMLHYHLLHFTVLRVPFRYVRDRLVFHQSIRYRLHFSEIGYVFQISVTFLKVHPASLCLPLVGLCLSVFGFLLMTYHRLLHVDFEGSVVSYCMLYQQLTSEL